MKNDRRKPAFIIFLLTVISLLAGCQTGDGAETATQTKFMLGTVITLTSYQKDADDALSAAFDRIAQIESEMSAKKAGTEIDTLNTKGTNKLTSDVFYVLKKALEMAKLSKGAFDPTVLPLSRLWGIDDDTKAKIVPAAREIEKARALVDYKKVGLDAKTRTAAIQTGMGVDLGGIAKGYAADEARRIFKEKGVKSAILDLGGNVVAIGNRPDGQPWRIGIRDPRAREEGGYYAVLSVRDQVVVTSGDYERYFEVNGVRYHHIFDTATGYPAKNGVISATIISGNSTEADALSTAVFVLGVEKGLALVESVEGTEAVIVTDDKKVYTTPGIRDKVEIVSKEYVLQ
ncbi:MAG: FAD:protein FMN transferase [Bacillota bacterium]